MSKQVLTRQRVLELIDQLQVGQAIPSERRLSTDLGVSRLTLRAALDDLVRDGYLERRHGSGTFVSEPKIAQQLTLTSFSEDMRRRGMVAGSRTIELRGIHAGAAVGRALKVSPDARVVLIRRLRLADGEPMALETLHVPAALARLPLRTHEPDSRRRDSRVRALALPGRPLPPRRRAVATPRPSGRAAGDALGSGGTRRRMSVAPLRLAPVRETMFPSRAPFFRSRLSP